MGNMKVIGAMLLMALMAVLAGCGGGPTPVVVMQGAEQTAIAATAFYDGATATADAALVRQSVPTATPRVQPTEDPALDEDAVIATVAGHDITVGEFRRRVRYERWSALETLHRIAETSGTEVLDITNPNNEMAPTVVGYLYTLGDEQAFAEDVLTQMIRERIMHQEYTDRALRPNTGLLNNYWMRLVGIEIPANNGGELPADFDATLQTFLAELGQYTAITEEELDFMLTVRSEQLTLLDAVGAEADYDTETVELHHILVATEEEANDIIQQLEDGADFAELAQEYSLDNGARGNGGDLGFFGVGEMVAPFEAAAFDAPLGDFVGPVATDFGYHILQVTDTHDAVQLDRLVVATEAEAEMALARLADGEDLTALVDELSVDPALDGDMGWVTADDLPDMIAETVMNAAIGDAVGPFPTSGGYGVMVVTDRRREEVRARHILVDTEEEALVALERLEAGEDFTAVVLDVSTDPTSAGDGGNLGFVTESQLPENYAEAAFAAPIGEIFGPIETDEGFHVSKVMDTNVNILTPNQYDEIKAVHFQNWLRRQVQAVEIDPIWETAYPVDPQPGDVDPYLAEMEAAMNEALAALDSNPTPTIAPEDGATS